MWQDYITMCVCVLDWGLLLSGEPECPLCNHCHCDYIEAEGFVDGDVDVTGVLAYPLHTVVLLCMCWQGCRPNMATVQCRALALLPSCQSGGSVCVWVRHKWHTTLVLDWHVRYQFNHPSSHWFPFLNGVLNYLLGMIYKYYTIVNTILNLYTVYKDLCVLLYTLNQNNLPIHKGRIHLSFT